MLRSSLLAAALLLTVAACSDGGAPSPTPSVTVAEQATGTSAPATSEAARARLIYLKDGDLWTADLDGSSPVRVATGGSAGFAGVVDGDVFYTLMDATREFTLFRVRAGAAPEELLRVQGSSKNEEFSWANAALSPSGEQVAFVDEDGLGLYDVATERTRRLLNNVPCTNATGRGCWGYFFPTWSPNGQKLSIEKIFFEGSRTAIIDDLSADPAVERVLDYGTFFYGHRWSPDGTRLCGPEDSYAGGPPIIVDVVSGTGTATLPLAEGQIFLQDCDWSSDGKLAILYTARSDATVPPPALAILSADGMLLLDMLPDPDAQRPATVRWANDRQLVVHVLEGEAQLVDLDGTVEQLNVPMDRLIGVVFY